MKAVRDFFLCSVSVLAGLAFSGGLETARDGVSLRVEDMHRDFVVGIRGSVVGMRFRDEMVQWCQPNGLRRRFLGGWISDIGTPQIWDDRPGIMLLRSNRAARPDHRA